MELAYYSDYALRLINSEEPARGKDALTSVEAVRALFGANQSAARRTTDADVTRFRSVRGRLRAVFEAANEGDETLAVDLLNSLLLEFPVSPQISGHDHRDDDGRPCGTCTWPTTRPTRPPATRRSPRWDSPST